MTTPLKIDIVSDVSCPWCAIGLGALQQALDTLGSDVRAELHFQPFELNPDMGEGGQAVSEHLTEKYGSTPEQQAQNWALIQQRAAAVGARFGSNEGRRIYNTFDAHRLLHWAGTQGEGRQLALKKALFELYFGDAQSPADHAVLLRAAQMAGLDKAQARAVLQGDKFADAVRAQEQHYRQAGIHSVPAFVINDRHLISGGQPPEVFVQALRQLAAG